MYSFTAYQTSVLKQAQKLVPPLTYKQREYLAEALHLKGRRVYQSMLKEKKKRLLVLRNKTACEGLLVLSLGCVFNLKVDNTSTTNCCSS